MPSRAGSRVRESRHFHTSDISSGGAMSAGNGLTYGVRAVRRCKSALAAAISSGSVSALMPSLALASAACTHRLVRDRALARHDLRYVFMM